MGDLWSLIVLVTISTGVVYYLLEYLRSFRHGDRELDADFKKVIFLSMNAFVGHSEFDPRASSLRMLTISMNFMYLILISAYTANLASFLVIESSSRIDINNFKDVIKHQKRICVERGLAYVDAVQKKYPESKHLMIEYENAKDMFLGLQNQKCLIL